MSHAPVPVASTTMEQGSLSHATLYEAKSALLEGMREFIGTTQYAVSGSLLTMPPPDLMIRDIGVLGLPLTDVQAKQLIEKGRRDRMESRVEPIGNLAQTKTWDISPQQISFRSPSKLWTTFIAELEQLVAKELGIKTRVMATMDKLAIQEAGALPSSSYGPEGCSASFGTMTITLPSFHRGGQTVFKHCGSSKEYDASRSRQSFAFWYHGIKHDCEPIVSGYRLVLVYTLFTTEPCITPTVQTYSEVHIRGALRSLRRHLLDAPDTPKAAVYFTSAKYSLEGVADSNREDSEEAREDLMQRIAESEGLQMLLGRLERIQEGPSILDFNIDLLKSTTDTSKMHNIVEIKEDSLHFHKVETPRGERITGRFSIKLDDCIQDHSLGVPDLVDNTVIAPDVEEYTRDERGCSEGYPNPISVHRYRSKGIVLVPRETYLTFLWGRAVNARDNTFENDTVIDTRHAILDYTRKRFNAGQPEWLSNSFTSLCKSVCDSYNDPDRDEWHIENLLQTIVAIDDPKLAVHVLTHSSRPSMAYFDCLERLSDRDDTKTLASQGNFVSWHFALELMVLSIESLSDELEALAYIEVGHAKAPETAQSGLHALEMHQGKPRTTTSSPKHYSFHEKMIVHLLRDASRNADAYREDGEELAIYVKRHHGAVLQSIRIEPELQKLHSSLQFMVAYLTRLRRSFDASSKTSSTHEESLQKHWHITATRFLRHFSKYRAFPSYCFPPDLFRELLQFILQDMRCPSSAHTRATGEANYNMLLYGIVTHIWDSESSARSTVVYGNILFVIASAVPRTSQELFLSADDVVLRDVLCRVLLTLRWCLIGPNPDLESLELMPVLSCECSVCAAVNAWLVDPYERRLVIETTSSKLGYILLFLWSYRKKPILGHRISRMGNRAWVTLKKMVAQEAHNFHFSNALDHIKHFDPMIRDVLGENLYSLIVTRDFSRDSYDPSLHDAGSPDNLNKASGVVRLEAIEKEYGLPPMEEVMRHTEGSLRTYLSSWHGTALPGKTGSPWAEKRALSHHCEMPPKKKGAFSTKDSSDEL